MTKPRILIVEDEAIVAMHIASQLELLGYQVAGTAATAEAALGLAEKERPDLVLMDVRLQGPNDGIVAAHQIRDRYRLPVVFLTAYAEDSTLERAKLAEPFGYILKPFEDRELKTVIEMALYKHKADEEIRRLNRLFSVLSQINQAIVRVRSREELFVAICRIAVELGGFRLAWIGWLDAEGQTLAPQAQAGDDLGFLRGRTLALDRSSQSLSLTVRAVLEGRSLVLNNFDSDPCSLPWREQVEAMGIRSAAAFPIRTQGVIGGSLSLYSTEPGFFQEPEVQLLDEIAVDLSFALEQMAIESQRQQAEESLRRARRDWENIFQAIGHPVLILDPEHRIIAANDAALRAARAALPDLVGRPCYQVFHGSNRSCPPEGCPTCSLAVGSPIETIEMEMEALDGVFLVSCTPVRNPAGELEKIIHIATDITRRKEAEEKLAQSEALYHSLVENLPQNVYRKNLEGRFTFVNQRFCQALGQPLEAILGRTSFDLFETGLAEQFQRDDRQVLESGQPLETVEQHQVAGQSPAYVRVCRTPLRDGQGRIIGLQGISWDITEQQRAEEALRQSEANLAAAQQMAHLGSWETDLASLEDLDRNPLRWSDEVFRIFGYAPGEIEVSRRNFFQAVHPEDRPRIQAAVLEALLLRQSYRIEHRIRRADGTERMVQEHAELVCDPATGRPRKLVGTVQDITERQQLEERLRQSQKLESFGTLASGVAHDFNNILSVILMNAEMLLGRPRLDPETLDSVRQIADAGRRAANLTRQLLTFSRQQPMRRQCLDLGAVVGNLTKMLRRIIGEDVSLQCNFSPDLLPVHADVGMLEQVLMNLAVNARDAMPQGGQLIITAERVRLEPDQLASRPGARAGDFACLRVQDTGTGIAPEHLPRIFEPFFTTKEVGKGTGLGLATAYGIIQQHEGWVEVESAPGQGATFKVFLPLSQQGGAADLATPPTPAARGGTEGVLVVEDEAPVRAMVCICLRRLGYQVFEAKNGPEALKVWAQHHSEVDLLFTDMIMPAGCSGVELAQRLQQEKPSLRILFMSGYSADLARNWPLEEGVNYLAKPFSPAALAKIVRDRLDAP